jgi:hypothetical protein
MGLSASIKAAVNSAFVALDDLQQTVYYQLTQQGAYVASTGATGLTYMEIPLKGFLVRYKQTEHDENEGLQPGDYKFIFQQSELADYATYGIPKMADRVVIENALDFKRRTWDIVTAKEDPVKAIWILGLRIGHPQDT